MRRATERRFRKVTSVVSGIIVVLACVLIVWPAVKDMQVALAWVDRPYRFVIETDGGYYLVGSSHRMSDEELRALFRRAVFEPGQDERAHLLFADPVRYTQELLGRHVSLLDLPPRGYVIAGPRRPVWWGLSQFLLPYALTVPVLAFLPWGVWYLVDFMTGGFVRERASHPRRGSGRRA